MPLATTIRTLRLTIRDVPGLGLCKFLPDSRTSVVLRKKFSCNEVGFFQDGAPIGHPSLVTRLVQPADDEVCPTNCFKTPLLKRYTVYVEAMPIDVPASLQQTACTQCCGNE